MLLDYNNAQQSLKSLHVVISTRYASILLQTQSQYRYHPALWIKQKVMLLANSGRFLRNLCNATFWQTLKHILLLFTIKLIRMAGNNYKKFCFWLLMCDIRNIILSVVAVTKAVTHNYYKCALKWNTNSPNYLNYWESNNAYLLPILTIWNLGHTHTDTHTVYWYFRLNDRISKRAAISLTEQSILNIEQFNSSI